MFSTLDLECRESGSVSAQSSANPNSAILGLGASPNSAIDRRVALGRRRGARCDLGGDTVKLQEILNARGKT